MLLKIVPALMRNLLFTYLEQRMGACGSIYESAVLKEAPLITISRESGCGASYIGSMLVERLNEKSYKPSQSRQWALVNKEIIEDAARALNVDYSEISSLFRSDPKREIDEIILSMSKRYYKSDKRKKTVIRKVIESLSYEGKRVIIGRGGFGVLSHHPSALHIKLHAPCQWRTEKIAERHGISFEDAKQYVKQTDESRLRLMNDFRSMNPSGNDFDVHFNCMSFSHEEIVNQLIELMKIKKLF